jgi:hypothetical protein
MNNLKFLEKDFLVLIISFFFLYNLYIFYNFNFDLKVYFCYISIPKLEKGKTKSQDSNKKKNSLIEVDFSALKYLFWCE